MPSDDGDTICASFQRAYDRPALGLVRHNARSRKPVNRHVVADRTVGQWLALIVPWILSNSGVYAWYPHRTMVAPCQLSRQILRRTTLTPLRYHHVVDETDALHHANTGATKLQFTASILSHLKVHNDNLSLDQPVAAELHIDEMARLHTENQRLHAQLKRVQDENQMLHFELSHRIVLETFEGEGKLRLPLETVPLASNHGDDTLDRSDGAELWCDALDENDTCPVEPMVSFLDALKDRAGWLVGLLVLQSGSGLILARNEELLANHPFIIYFLTMLVGAGGNAGNQASVRVIRGLALGTLNDQTQTQFLWREFKMASALSGILALAGFVRAAMFATPLAETIAVTVSLTLIVFSSVCLGAVLPLLLKSLRVDPAHSSTTIQVVMDILGVVLAVCVSRLLLDSRLGSFLIATLSGGNI